MDKFFHKQVGFYIFGGKNKTKRNPIEKKQFMSHCNQ